ncbi:MAG: hypothetical protein IJZ74_02660 [Clostridia bacterium]|nr:hypothetical protein [Clostridia bacterium]
MMNAFDGICGRVAPGLCRFSMNGSIAIRTRAGYRTYDVDSNKLTNCDSFAFDVGEDFFFVVPTNKVKPGDIILAGGKPKCVIKADEKTITAIKYEDATVETLLPERHMFMGGTYLYGKIVSMLGHGGVKGRKGAGRMMKYMMLSSLIKGRDGERGQNGSLSSLLPLMLMGGKTDFMDDLFDLDDDADDDVKKEA